MAARARWLKSWARQPGVTRVEPRAAQAPPDARADLWQWLKKLCKAVRLGVSESSRARGNARQHPTGNDDTDSGIKLGQ
eukprot:14897280-Alexandrium_andersonii.AAC.1